MGTITDSRNCVDACVLLAACIGISACGDHTTSNPARAAAPPPYTGAVADATDARTPSRDIKYVKTSVSPDGAWTLRVSYYAAMRKGTKALQRAALLQRAADGACGDVVSIVATWTSPLAHSAAGAYDGSAGGGASNIAWTVSRTTSSDRRSLTIRFHDPRLADHEFCAVDSLTLSHFKRYDSADRIKLRPTS